MPHSSVSEGGMIVRCPPELSVVILNCIFASDTWNNHRFPLLSSSFYEAHAANLLKKWSFLYVDHAGYGYLYLELFSGLALILLIAAFRSRCKPGSHTVGLPELRLYIPNS